MVISPQGLCIVSMILFKLTVASKLDSGVRTVKHPSKGERLIVSFDSL